MSGRSLGGYEITSAVNPELAHDRPNIGIVTDVLVDKILFSNAGDQPLRATSVQFQHKSQTHTVHATKEVILAAGAFGSPNILERSGLGNGDHLRGFGIECILENPSIGENLQEHFMCGVSFEVHDDIETNDNFRDPAYAQAVMQQYQKHRTGPLTGTSACFAYMPLLDEDKPGQATPKQLLDDYHSEPRDTTSPVQTILEAFTKKVLSHPSEASANLCKYITIMTALAHLSRGSIHITSSSPSAEPAIDPRYYTHPLGTELMARQVKLLDRITKTPPLSDLIKPNGRRIPKWAAFDTLDDMKKLLRESCMSNYHPCGTVAMLPRDKGGVVDPRLRVYGVEGLRVCDASIMPVITRGNLMTSVYAIAEKGADMIKEDLGVL
ncbi:hypothetical protein OHC33_000169 [Knufia fluminis]|uniref:Glucose-methanol-choline oxidoreductase N-terminal domain-containing protein n=1 Tax=Knufia fluminis TaxID=191047 RepID=A0AAN8ISL9_9EURO|nr:hypothetical protein OHC33_000169 [Knufia fluminis]